MDEDRWMGMWQKNFEEDQIVECAFSEWVGRVCNRNEIVGQHY